MSFTKIGEHTLATNGFLTMVERSFRADGVAYQRTIVKHPGAVVVVPVLDDNRVVVVRQFRPSIEDYLLELPAGKRDVPGEAPIVTAERELQEECGLRASHLVAIGSFFNSPGFTDEHTHAILALGLELVPNAPQSAEEAEIQVQAIPIGEPSACIPLLPLNDAKSIVGITLAKHYIKEHPIEVTRYRDAPEVRERFP
ncbi:MULTISPECIES: NUDIX hydrolase [Ferrimicrobium]|uniref:NUDIX hydrolase n=1 Tax=Ferrimicrobium acidiphilum TaxID=121039 RepID=A0ABV3Y4D3_9ACTN|nr:NUDIX hydrolase [Ferrimicrobium sp.]